MPQDFEDDFWDIPFQAKLKNGEDPETRPYCDNTVSVCLKSCIAS